METAGKEGVIYVRAAWQGVNGAHTNNELVKTKITHDVCGSCLGVRLERGISAVSVSAQ